MGVYVDLTTEQLFNYAKDDTNKEVHRRFTTTQAPKCNKYILKLEEHVQEANLAEKAEQLEKEMKDTRELGPQGRSELIRRCQLLFEKMTQVMIASERKVGRKRYQNEYPSSRELTSRADEYFQTKNDLRMWQNLNKIKDERMKIKAEIVKEKRRS